MYCSGMTAPTWTLEDLRKLVGRGEPLIVAATEVIAGAEAIIKEARILRDTEVAAMAKQLGPAEAARRTGLSLSSVRVIRKAAR